MLIIAKSEVRNPSAWRSGRWKMSRSIRAVSMATSEYFRCPPRVPLWPGSQAVIASGDNHNVTSPRRTKARS